MLFFARVAAATALLLYSHDCAAFSSRRSPADISRKGVAIRAQTQELSAVERLGRSARFYSNVLPILARYKVKELDLERRCASEDECSIEYDLLDEWGSSKLLETISELQGFYVKSGQVMSTRVDLFPRAYTDKLQVLQDGLEPLDASLIKDVIQEDLLAGAELSEVFATFNDVPIGCASIAQVHEATLLDGRKVAVKVQRPNCEPRLLGDVANLKRFAKILAKQLPVDYYTVFQELAEVLRYELDFLHEAQATEKIHASLSCGGTEKPPLQVPLPIPGLASRRVLVLEFCEGTPLSKLAEEAKKRGIKPDSPEAKILGIKIVDALADAYARMIFDAGFVHGDPHPGNIFVQPGGNVALLDCGQVKQLSLAARSKIGALVAAVARTEQAPALREIADLVRKFGVQLQPREEGGSANDDDACLTAIALLLFGPVGAELPGGYSADELSAESPLRRLASFPPEFVLLGRAAVLIKGIATRLLFDNDEKFSLARRWQPNAEAAAQRDSTSADALPAWTRRQQLLTREANKKVTASEVIKSLTSTLWLVRVFALSALSKLIPQRIKSKIVTLAARLLLFFKSRKQQQQRPPAPSSS